MKRALAAIGAMVLAGGLTAGLSAQVQRGRQADRIDVVEVQKRPCAQLPELRQELLRLHQELRRLEAALKQAREAGNRERAQEIMQEIRIVKEKIDETQHEIRRLIDACN